MVFHSTLSKDNSVSWKHKQVLLGSCSKNKTRLFRCTMEESETAACLHNIPVIRSCFFLFIDFFYMAETSVTLPCPALGEGAGKQSRLNHTFLRRKAQSDDAAVSRQDF